MFFKLHRHHHHHHHRIFGDSRLFFDLNLLGEILELNMKRKIQRNKRRHLNITFPSQFLNQLGFKPKEVVKEIEEEKRKWQLREKRKEKTLTARWKHFLILFIFLFVV